MFLFIVITIILIIFAITLFIVLRSFSKEINNKAKKYFLNKEQEYYEMLKKKSSQSEDNKEDKKEEEKEEDNNVKVIVVENNNNQYEMNNLFDIAKEIDKKFQLNFDYEQLVKYFSQIKRPKEYTERYRKINEMKDYINSIDLYTIMTSEDTKVMPNLLKKLKSIDESLYEKYFINDRKFDIQEFMNYLDSEALTYDPNVYVYVGNKSINYDYLGDNVKTIYSDKIYKGIQIIYGNQLFDYSLGD